MSLHFPPSPAAQARLRGRRHTAAGVPPAAHRPAMVAWLALLASGSAWCQQPAAPAPVVITGNPLGGTLAQPSAVLAGEGLAQRRAGTLGETLDGLPGVAATGFGPQSSRPVIRGLDGDRIRLLDNGGAATDASNLSFDHAVAIDPLVIERLEVLRGPQALLYGGNATGGVVNTIDNRIPRQALGALGGRAELRLGGPARDRAGAAVLEAGAGGLNWHADVAARESSDLRTPRFRPEFDGQRADPAQRVVNSAGSSRAGAVGASLTGAQGFIGLALDGYRNDYGVTVEPDVTIRMDRQRLQLAGERRGLAGPFETLSMQGGATQYQHQEVEGDGAVGTTFKSQGRDLRLQATQRPLALAGGTLQGVLGLQLERIRFSALGEEAFLPRTRTRSQALFALQSLALGPLTLTAGARVERVQVASDGDAADAAEPRFGAAAQRSFSPRSLLLSAQGPLGDAASPWRWSASLGSTQRAPADYELYANGLHVATGVVEVGDPDQRLERSRHAELGLAWQRAGHSLRLALWQTRFANYIALDTDGSTQTVEDEDGGSSEVPIYRFAGVPARLQGLEIEGRSRLLQGPTTLDLHASLDGVRGSNRRTGAALPRLAPWRALAGVTLAQGPWQAGANLRLAARQDRVPATDTATPGHALLDLWASWRQSWGAGTDAVWTLKLSNAGNQVAYNASALRSARLLTPAGARALQLGLRVGF